MKTYPTGGVRAEGMYMYMSCSTRFTPASRIDGAPEKSQCVRVTGSLPHRRGLDPSCPLLVRSGLLLLLEFIAAHKPSQSHGRYGIHYATRVTETTAAAAARGMYMRSLRHPPGCPACRPALFRLAALSSFVILVLNPVAGCNTR